MGEKTSEWNMSFSITTLVFFLIASSGLIYLYLKTQSSLVAFYLFLALFTFVLIFVLFFFMKDKDWRDIFGRVPLERGFEQSNYNFVVGFFVMVILNIVKPKFIPESVLFSQNFFEILPSGALGEVFTKMWVAGTIEQLFFVITFVIIGAVIFYYAIKALDLKLSPTYLKFGAITTGIIFSMALFTTAHKFNPTYVNIGDFLIALGFISITAAIAWAIGAFNFGMGAHFGNNAVAIGLAIVGLALLSLYGFLLGLVIILLVYAAFRGIVQGKVNLLMYESSNS